MGCGVPELVGELPPGGTFDEKLGDEPGDAVDALLNFVVVLPCRPPPEEPQIPEAMTNVYCLSAGRFCVGVMLACRVVLL